MDYKKRYGLKEAPFRLSPDPDFFFPSETHRDAMETLLYAIRAGEGFIQITGHPGTGKSMLLRKILKEIGDSVVVGLILHANIEAGDLLPILMQDLKIDISGVPLPSRSNLIPLFRDFLLAQAQGGKQVIIIVDEAQNLPDETLEELRMLSNLETEKAKLLQIILVGQLELEQRITPARLSQLSQRITIRYRLKPLNLEETRAYIFHRLEIAAVNRDIISVAFRTGVMGAIHRYSRGIPRLINIVCERALMAAYIQGDSQISRPHVKKAILSIDGDHDTAEKSFLYRPVTYWLFAALLVIVGLWAYFHTNLDLSLVSQTLSSQKRPTNVSAINGFAHTRKWITLPRGVEQVGLINIDKGVLVMVRKKNNELVQSDEVKVEWPYPQGVYMAGYSSHKEPFIFHPEITYLKTIQLDNPNFWQMVRNGNKNCITPLVAVNLPSQLTMDITPGSDTVQQMVNGWAQTWRTMDLEKIMGYFNYVTATYDLAMDHPLVYSKAQMHAIKQNILQHSKFVQLDLTNPICLVNPLDPNAAYAVFYQTYRSSTYQDRGTKVLYLRRFNSASAEIQWKITGKLWILDSNFKTENTMTP